MRWQEISNDPNSVEVINNRKQAIKMARQKPVADRLAYIRQLCVGKNVLDVGIIDHVAGKQHSPDWLHGAIASVAAKILGVDILPEAIESLKQEGYNVLLWDITKASLEQKFDVIVVSEVIEHLNNPGALLESASRMLAPQGRLVLTTPNPYYIARVRDNLRFGFGWDSVDHVTFLYPFGIAELCERAGLRLVTWRGFLASEPPTVFGKIIMRLVKLLPFSRETFCHALIYECGI